MKILSIEPTPSPNVMKLNLDSTLAEGESYNFMKNEAVDAPQHLQALLRIEGVKSAFQVLDFIALERHPKAKWQTVLAEARRALGEEQSPIAVEKAEEMVHADEYKEVNVSIQKIKGIPIQIKLMKNDEEKRIGLPDRFRQAVMDVQNKVSNLVFERKWEEESARYGDLTSVGDAVLEEISAAYDEVRLQQLVDQADVSAEQQLSLSMNEVLTALHAPDWETRFAALEQLEPTISSMSIIEKALTDDKTAIRRLAVVYLGFIGEEHVKEILPLLYQALKDASAMVRRTAGDTLSDLGDPEAIVAMCEALSDKNKLVRWRAARFLYEVGDEQAIPALQQAIDDPEFEVSLQAKIALERIEKGEEASGTVWQQMTKRMAEDQ
ncbi:virulence factor [Hazenella sp. IB182353]|uniref:conserved virulence factor C family protein n=1 Tax=Polycladospora coralii TaxID=2771432 RepID=UPI001746E9F3|nr:virulence factor [Polycladospora coralii]MBS7530878.1 virulence factor [Polycladospora coralii]